MKLHCVSRFAVAALICLMPVAAYPAQSQASDVGGDMSAEELAAIADHMRETSEKMRADLKKARARFEARKAQLDAQHEVEAEPAKKVAAIPSNKASKQHPPQESAAKSLARREAEREQAEINAMEERTARAFAELKAVEDKQARAAKALTEARRQVGVSAFAEE
jgi:hypothetical protein